MKKQQCSERALNGSQSRVGAMKERVLDEGLLFSHLAVKPAARNRVVNIGPAVTTAWVVRIAAAMYGEGLKVGDGVMRHRVIAMGMAARISRPVEVDTEKVPH